MATVKESDANRPGMVHEATVAVPVRPLGGSIRCPYCGAWQFDADIVGMGRFRVCCRNRRCRRRFAYQRGRLTR